MLSERLQELEQEGLVERAVVPETPVRVEYSLTKKGKALADAIDSIATWAEKYMPLAAPGGKTPGNRLDRQGRRAMICGVKRRLRRAAFAMAAAVLGVRRSGDRSAASRSRSSGARRCSTTTSSRWRPRQLADARLARLLLRAARARALQELSDLPPVEEPAGYLDRLRTLEPERDLRCGDAQDRRPTGSPRAATCSRCRSATTARS